jgi:hypothetical protein
MGSMKTAVHTQRVLRVAREIAALALTEPSPAVRQAARRHARTLLEVARLLSYRRWGSAREKVDGCPRTAAMLPKSVKRFLRSRTP